MPLFSYQANRFDAAKAYQLVAKLVMQDCVLKDAESQKFLVDLSIVIWYFWRRVELILAASHRRTKCSTLHHTDLHGSASMGSIRQQNT